MKGNSATPVVIRYFLSLAAPRSPNPRATASGFCVKNLKTLPARGFYLFPTFASLSFPASDFGGI